MIYIARNRNVLTHSFFRVLGPGDPVLMPEGDLPVFINGLISAKGHKQLVSAIEGCRCLLLDTRGSAKQPKRMLTANECIDELQCNYVPANGHKLAQEMYMLSPKQLRANSSKESPAVAFDAYSGDFIGKLKQMNPRARIAIEPVQDWMTFRNFLTVVACLLANIETFLQMDASWRQPGSPEPARLSSSFQPSGSRLSSTLPFSLDPWLIR